jgi:ribosomal protein L29
MKLSKINSSYQALNNFSDPVEINTEIFSLKKSLLLLRLEAVRKKIKKNHLYRNTKKKIAQLYFKKSLLEKK